MGRRHPLPGAGGRPNERLVYAWAGGHKENVGYGAPLDTVVTWTLAKVAGGTRLRMIHSGFITPQNGAPQDLPPFIATPAFARAHPEGTGVLAATLVRLRPGADVNAYIDGVNAIDVTVSRPAPLAGFPAISAVTTAAQSRAATNTSTNVLTTGLLLLAGVGALAGAAAVAQAVVRHHAATAHTQRVEAAMGLTSMQRAQARLLAAIPAAVVAVLLTVVIALACAGIGPPGALRTVEPNPGWAPNLALLGLAVVVIPVALLALVGISARRAGRRTEPRGGRDARFVSRLALLGGRPPSALGLRFALERPPGATGTSTRAPRSRPSPPASPRCWRR